jgi:hypothetical protein
MVSFEDRHPHAKFSQDGSLLIIAHALDALTGIEKALVEASQSVRDLIRLTLLLEQEIIDF